MGCLTVAIGLLVGSLSPATLGGSLLGEAPVEALAAPIKPDPVGADTGYDEAEFPPQPGLAVDGKLARDAGVSSRGGLRSPSASPLESLPDWKRSFVETAGEAARASQASTGVPASVTIAQAILESNWGQATIKAANNYFGVKATSGPGNAGVVWAQTREFVNGAWITVNAPFRAYQSMADSFTDHGQFLVENPRYARAFQYADDPRAFAKLIHEAGYATDPNYSKSLIRLMDQLDLYQFDLP